MQTSKRKKLELGGGTRETESLGWRFQEEKGGQKEAGVSSMVGGWGEDEVVTEMVAV